MVEIGKRNKTESGWSGSTPDECQVRFAQFLSDVICQPHFSLFGTQSMVQPLKLIPHRTNQHVHKLDLVHIA